jgi:sarcosine oxidase subunit gamma
VSLVSRRTNSPTQVAPRQSPLKGIDLPNGMGELPFPSQVDLRLNLGDSDLASTLEARLGFPLPTIPNTISGDPNDRHALWLGPDEWLVVGRPGEEEEIVRILHEATEGRYRAITDVSASRTTIELFGPGARETLEAGCAIDLHPRSFGPGQCAQTMLARVNVILSQVSNEPRYRVLVRASFARSLAAWLVDAAAGVVSEPSGSMRPA